VHGLAAKRKREGRHDGDAAFAAPPQDVLRSWK